MSIQTVMVICPWLLSLALVLILTGEKWKSEGRLLKDPECKEKEGGRLQQLGKLALIFAMVLVLLMAAYANWYVFSVICSG